MLAYSQGDNVRASQSSMRAADLARQVGDKRALAIVLGFQASSLMFIGDLERVLPLLEEAVEAGRESGDKLAMGLPMGMQGQALSMLGHAPEMARAQAEKGATLVEESGDRWAATMALLSMAMGAKYRGEYAEARARFAACAPRFRDLGDRHRINMVKSELAHLDRLEGQLAKAEAVYRETILEWKRLGHRAAIAHQLECFATLAQAGEQPERAARLFGAAEALREKIGIAMTPVERVEYDALIASLRAGMHDGAFSSSWSDGRTLSMEQAIAFALQAKNGTPVASPKK
jgi:hypothetical protein